MIDKVVDFQQMTFINGRQVMDVVLIAYEVVDSKVKHKKRGILCKLDIEKGLWLCLLVVTLKGVIMYEYWGEMDQMGWILYFKFSNINSQAWLTVHLKDFF